MNTTALIVIDVQNALFQAQPRPFEADAVLDRIRRLTESARAAGVPVVWVQHEQAGSALVFGSTAWDLPDALQAGPGDPRFRKTTPDAFLRTGLAEWLTARGLRHLVICGYATEFSIDTSTRRAAALGLAVTLAADAHTTHDKPHASASAIRAHHNATLPGLGFGPEIRAMASEAIDFEARPTAAAAAANPHRVSDPLQLAALYGQPSEASRRKESPVLTAPYAALLAASPCMVLATSGPDGLDASPRGDWPTALVIQDERSLLLPDRRGNHRLDSLRNLLTDPRVALLCLIPGRSETLRINGRAHISTDPALCARLAIEGKLPACVVVIDIEVVYFQCARALLRSRLWHSETWPAANSLPSAGQMLSAASAGGFDGAAYDRDQPLRLKDGLY
jgi:PPOX class probable FMN-dependent enzyme